MFNIVESDIIQAILKDEKIEKTEDDKYQTFPQTPEEIKKEENENRNFFINQQLKINQRDFETINNIINEDAEKIEHNFNWVNIPIFNEIFVPDDIYPDNNPSSLGVDTRNKFDTKMNEIKKKQKNINAMINKEILDSIILEK